MCNIFRTGLLSSITTKVKTIHSYVAFILIHLAAWMEIQCVCVCGLITLELVAEQI